MRGKLKLEKILLSNLNENGDSWQTAKRNRKTHKRKSYKQPSLTIKHWRIVSSNNSVESAYIWQQSSDPPAVSELKFDACIRCVGIAITPLSTHTQFVVSGFKKCICVTNCVQAVCSFFLCWSAVSDKVWGDFKRREEVKKGKKTISVCTDIPREEIRKCDRERVRARACKGSISNYYWSRGRLAYLFLLLLLVTTVLYYHSRYHPTFVDHTTINLPLGWGLCYGNI